MTWRHLLFLSLLLLFSGCAKRNHSAASPEPPKVSKVVYERVKRQLEISNSELGGCRNKLAGLNRDLEETRSSISDLHDAKEEAKAEFESRNKLLMTMLRMFDRSSEVQIQIMHSSDFLKKAVAGKEPFGCFLRRNAQN